MKMNNSTGYRSANPQTGFAVFGCGIVMLVGALFVMLLMALGLGA